MERGQAGEQTRGASTSQRLGLKCGDYSLKANERYFSKSISLVRGGRRHRARVGTRERWTGADCGRPCLPPSLTRIPQETEPLEGLGSLGGGIIHSDSWNQHAQWKRGVRDQRQGTGLKDTAPKVRACSGASRKDWKS